MNSYLNAYNSYFAPGDLVHFKPTSIWDHNAPNGSSVIGLVRKGDALLVLEMSDYEAKVLAPNGVVGYVNLAYYLGRINETG